MAISNCLNLKSIKWKNITVKFNNSNNVRISVVDHTPSVSSFSSSSLTEYEPETKTDETSPESSSNTKTSYTSTSASSRVPEDETLHFLDSKAIFSTLLTHISSSFNDEDILGGIEFLRNYTKELSAESLKSEEINELQIELGFLSENLSYSDLVDSNEIQNREAPKNSIIEKEKFDILARRMIRIVKYMSQIPKTYQYAPEIYRKYSYPKMTEAEKDLIIELNLRSASQESDSNQAKTILTLTSSGEIVKQYIGTSFTDSEDVKALKFEPFEIPNLKDNFKILNSDAEIDKGQVAKTKTFLEFIEVFYKPFSSISYCKKSSKLLICTKNKMCDFNSDMDYKQNKCKFYTKHLFKGNETKTKLNLVKKNYLSRTSRMVNKFRVSNPLVQGFDQYENRMSPFAEWLKAMHDEEQYYGTIEHVATNKIANIIAESIIINTNLPFSTIRNILYSKFKNRSKCSQERQLIDKIMLEKRCNGFHYSPITALFKGLSTKPKRNLK